MKKIFTAVIAMMMTFSVSAQFYIYLSNGEVLQADSISMVAPSTPVTPPTPSGDGVLNGKFSVSATEQVSFSQGNLQYQASTGTWRFAENQYDMIGEYNAAISSSYNGWIDLFGWGTGNNPTNTSTEASDYSTFTDWGVNAISNGGNTANAWRTLTKDEWVYLFHDRENAEKLFGLGCVNDVIGVPVKGVIILPDNWTTPVDVNFVASTMEGLKWESSYYVCNSEFENCFDYNTYTASEWQKMEAAGAVFLPAAGNRYEDTSVYGGGSFGCYWSSTPCEEGYAYGSFFRSKYLNPQDNANRYSGQSVRLVR